MTRPPTRVLLVGGGHSHLEVLRRFALQPDPTIALSLVSPEAASFYSGMLPGVVAGLYAREEASIAIEPLARDARATWMADRVVALALDAGVAKLALGASVEFEVLSLDVGSQPDARIDGAGEHAIPVRPGVRFFDAWRRTLADVADRLVRRIAVVGAGAGGVELALAMRAACARVGVAIPIALATDEPSILQNHGRLARAWLADELKRHAIDVHTGARVVSIERHAVVTAQGERIAADRIFLATTAVAQAWLGQSGLRCDARGFVEIDDTLQSRSHPFVFASGDCATVVGRPHPKSGAHAVRQGPALAANLRAFAHGGALARVPPRRTTLSLIGTGDRRAVLSFGALAARGAWLWKLKDRIDRRHVERYASLSRRSAGSRDGHASR